MLDFIIGDSATWPRIGPSQAQDQHVDWNRRRVCWTKYQRADMFECWRWDDQFIYHEIDAGLDGSRAGESYKFSDGRFLPRYLTAARWTLTVENNFIRWYDRQCREIESREGVRTSSGEYQFPYTVTGVIENGELIMTYAGHMPGAAPTGPEERFYFAGKGSSRGALGWWRWQRSPHVVDFSAPGGVSKPPIGCHAN